MRHYLLHNQTQNPTVLKPLRSVGSNAWDTCSGFSYSTYVINPTSIDLIDEVIDTKITASTGVNRFTAGPASSQAANAGTYDIYVTPTGKQGYANEIAYSPNGEWLWYVRGEL